MPLEFSLQEKKKPSFFKFGSHLHNVTHQPCCVSEWLSHWHHSKNHLLVAHPQKDETWITIIDVYLAWSKTRLSAHSYKIAYSPFPDGSLPSLHFYQPPLVFLNTHIPTFPPRLGQNMPFSLSIAIPLSSFPSHSEQANTWPTYLYIYWDSCWLEVDVPSERNNGGFVPVTDRQAGCCQVN